MNKKVYIKQDGNIPGHRIIEELERRGGINGWRTTGSLCEVCYSIRETCDYIDGVEIETYPYNTYTELLYNKETDSFYEKSKRIISAEAKEALLPNTIEEGEYNIPKGYEANVEDGKIIIKKKGWPPKEGDIVYFPCADTYRSGKIHFSAYNTRYHYGCRIDKAIMFVTKEDCKAFCEKLDAVINQLIENRRKEAEKWR